MPEKVLIIGSGPAGWTAAIYAARANLDPIVYEGGYSEENRLKGTMPLGQLNLTTEVENFPGFPEGVMGPDLMVRMRQQAEKNGSRILTEDIVSIDLSKRPFTAVSESGATIDAHTIIVATGASANYLGLESEGNFKNRGVSACAVCDGALPRFRGKPLVVVGGGDTAAEEASYLTRFASTVYLVHRRDALRASKVMSDRVLANPKIKPIWKHQIDEVLGDEERGVTAVRVKHVDGGGTQTLDATGMFVAIGHTPNTKFLNGQLQLDKHGFLYLPHPPHMHTSVNGVYAAGDVADPHYKQAVTAAGMGCRAALDAQRYLEEHGLI